MGWGGVRGKKLAKGDRVSGLQNEVMALMDRDVSQQHKHI